MHSWSHVLLIFLFFFNLFSLLFLFLSNTVLDFGIGPSQSQKLVQTVPSLMRTTLVASLVVVWSQPALLKQWLFTWLICYFLLIFPLLFIQISIGYFITDLAMILWRFPALGGLEYVSWKILFFFSLGCCTYLYTFMMRWIQYPSYVIRKWQTNLFIFI